MLPPHELKNKTFSKSMRGYNPVEVDEYVEFLIEKYTEIYRENDELERKLKAATTRLDEIKGSEDAIRSSLIDAKRLANKIKADAEVRAESIIRAAKTSCNTILSDFNEKIAYGRDTYAALQQDVVALKNELFERYSAHIRFVDSLTEGIDEENIPEISELRRQAMDELKAEIAAEYSTASEESTEEADQASYDYETADSDDGELVAVEMQEIGAYYDEPTDDPEEAVETEMIPAPRNNSIKGNIQELNAMYKQSNEDVINTPDSDLGDDEGYLDFVKSVTGTKSDSKQRDKDADFEAIFDDGRNKKRK